jgi:hypothetical protein
MPDSPTRMPEAVSSRNLTSRRHRSHKVRVEIPMKRRDAVTAQRNAGIPPERNRRRRSHNAPEPKNIYDGLRSGTAPTGAQFPMSQSSLRGCCPPK